NMGKANFAPQSLPVLLDGDKIINRSVTIGDDEYKINCISMGNPHCVVFHENVDSLNLKKVGKTFEFAPIFPERVNAEFVSIIDRNTIKMRTWERGSGETLACGTGACAATVAAVENGYCRKDEDILVKLKGGDLIVRYTDDAVLLTGKAEQVFEGVIEI
ncbi:MAG: diaminopimelate epimerase, partial [Oscillospiraceae bacterium]